MAESLRPPSRLLTRSHRSAAGRRLTWLSSALTALAIVVGVGASALVATPPAPAHCLMTDQAGSRTCFATYREAISHATDGAIDDAPLTARAAASDPAFRTRLEAYNATAAAPAASAGAHARLAGDRIALVARHDATCPGQNMSGKKFSTQHCVIGATLFDRTGFNGNSYTLWIPHPCEADGWQDYGWRVDTAALPIRSMQVWGAKCRAWLWHQDLTGKDGPFKEGNYPDLGGWNGKVEVFTLS